MILRKTTPDLHTNPVEVVTADSNTAKRKSSEILGVQTVMLLIFSVIIMGGLVMATQALAHSNTGRQKVAEQCGITDIQTTRGKASADSKGTLATAKVKGDLTAVQIVQSKTNYTVLDLSGNKTLCSVSV